MLRKEIYSGTLGFHSAAIGEIRFADGTTMDYAAILAQGFDIDGTAFDDAGSAALIGTSVTDRIRGFAGSDELEGRDGDDGLIGGLGTASWEGAAIPRSCRARENRNLLFLFNIFRNEQNGIPQKIFHFGRFDTTHHGYHAVWNNQQATVQRCGRRTGANMRRRKHTVSDQAARRHVA